MGDSRDAGAGEPSDVREDGWRGWLRPLVMPGLVVGLALWLAGLLWLAWLAADDGLRLLLAVAARH